MSFHVTVPFEFTGEYGGFVFTEEGKRRMRLRVGERDYLLKVPKIFRRRIDANFRAGQVLHVIGTEERDEISGVSKWILSEVLPPGGGRAAHRSSGDGTIRVCSKKNCWRDGGCELWNYLERETTARSLDGVVKLKAVDCLDRCKHAPNLEWRGQTFSDCTPTNAGAILDRIEAGARFAEPAPQPS